MRQLANRIGPATPVLTDDIYRDTYQQKRVIMKTAKLFDNGRSQALRLPKEYRFRGREVYVRKLDGLVLLIPKSSPWASLVRSLERFSSDFLEAREQPPLQSRDPL